MDAKKVEQQPKESTEERNIRILESDIWRLEQMMAHQQKKREELLNARAQMIAEMERQKAQPKEEDTTTPTK